ncbi:hypothetical protein TR13x_00410 [Caloranaerobacter sp. TR13]|uniref:MarR family winged helix-turn-helix transcriptional regulator n=1 Tax=Caloranaerobacter sp. TR13 TaxID=1302151 RepID=UPI0006D3E5F6|nr:MarR family transcriptional regulator [Caloranaerobacter sp. TR13]KPU27857.1 hypothetical protein TR13x_00410 [Caloranaerobacter sp. TR13]
MNIETNNKNGMIDSLSSLLVSLNKKLASELQDKISKDITLSQLIILKQINRGIHTVSSLSEKLTISAPAASKLIEQLHKSGFVIRKRSDKDRRVVFIELTDKGKEILKNNEQIRNEVFKEMLSPLSKNEIDTLINILKKIIE